MEKRVELREVTIEEGLANNSVCYAKIRPTEELVERVARAICRADMVLPDEFGTSGKPRWMQYIKQAKAAIAAINGLYTPAPKRYD